MVQNNSHLESSEPSKRYHPALVTNLDVLTVEKEITGYLFSENTTNWLYRILYNINIKREGNKNLYLISGRIGTGKTLFLKYITYLINENTSKRAFVEFENAVSNIKSEITIADVKFLEEKILKFNYNIIIFNLSHVESGNGIVDAFFKQFNKYRGYNEFDIPLTILLERRLDINGKFLDFKKRIENKLGFNWETDAMTLVSCQLESVLKIAKESCNKIDINAIRNQLSNPKSFADELNQIFENEIKEYLEEKEKDYRLMFFADDLQMSDFSSESKILEIKYLFNQLTSFDSRIAFLLSSASLDEDNPYNKNMIELRDKIFVNKINLE